MSIRSYKLTVGVLLCVLVLVLWRYLGLYGQVVTAEFIDKHCQNTQDSVNAFPLLTPPNPAYLAHDLQFLMGYYAGSSNSLVGSRLEQIVRRDYEQTLTNAVALFRRETTNDLGSDPRAWVQEYAH